MFIATLLDSLGFIERFLIGMDPGLFASHLQHGLVSKDWLLLEKTMTTAQPFVKHATFYCLNNLLLVAGERAIFHAETRFEFRNKIETYFHVKRII